MKFKKKYNVINERSGANWLPIENLPNHVLDNIFIYLPLTMLLKFSFSNHHYYEMIQNKIIEALWKNHQGEDYLVSGKISKITPFFASQALKNKEIRRLDKSIKSKKRQHTALAVISIPLGLLTLGIYTLFSIEANDQLRKKIAMCERERGEKMDSQATILQFQTNQPMVVIKKI